MSPFAVLISGLLRSVPSHRTDWIRPGSATDQVWSAIVTTQIAWEVEKMREVVG